MNTPILCECQADNGMCHHPRCRQGRDCPARYCAAEGGRHADPVPSGTTGRRLRVGPALGLLLLACSAVAVCYGIAKAAAAFWPG